ncbi:MAG: hypothetical protein JWL64_2431 [Frankiales bacterium]|nr:hypothetical protein [Frankiales bacterium]
MVQGRARVREGRLRDATIDRLADAGVIGRRRDRVLGIRVTRHPVLQADVRDRVVARLRAAAAGDDELDPRTAVVLALSGPARLLEVAPERPRVHARQRIAEAAELTPVAEVVRRVISEAAAATAAVVAGSVAATGGAG